MGGEIGPIKRGILLSVVVRERDGGGGSWLEELAETADCTVHSEKGVRT